MKVLFITDPGIIGGATKSLVELTQELQNTYGIEITVLTSKYTELNAMLAKNGIASIADLHPAVMKPQNSSGLFSKILWRLKVFVKKRISAVYDSMAIDFSQFDLIHTNSARNDIGCYLSRKYSIKHIVHLREFGTLDFGCIFFHRDYYSYLNRYVDRFIAISYSVMNYWVEQGVSDSKVKVIYNGVNEKDIERVNYDTFYSDTLKLVICGGICEEKGQLQVVQAISILPIDVREKISLDIYGWGNDRYIEKINSFADENEMNNIHIKGVSNEINKILCNYHIGLTCSKCEGFGRVTAEYMLAGIAVVASNTGANIELIKDSINGMIYEYGNIKDLSDKIMYLYRNRDELINIGKKGYMEAIRKYRIETNAYNIYKEYEEMLKK